jgi:hypothetical protein
VTDRDIIIGETLNDSDSPAGWALSNGIGRVIVIGGIFTKPEKELFSTGKSDFPINLKKQAGHIRSTPQYANRIKQGWTTSSFFGKESGNKLTQWVWHSIKGYWQKTIQIL